MRDFSKAASTGKTAVRQIRGPGMNLGLKKSPRPKKPPKMRDPYKHPKAKKTGLSFLKDFF